MAGKKATCPRFEIHVSEYPAKSGPANALDFEARMVGKHPLDQTGHMGIVSADIDENGRYSVSAAFVKPAYQRCGVGTKLYTAAAQWGCERGFRLRSDTQRSIDSDSFWRKQVSKGRAACVESAAERYITKSTVINRGGCAQYELVCPVTDLSGRPRRATRSRRPRSRRGAGRSRSSSRR